MAIIGGSRSRLDTLSSAWHDLAADLHRHNLRAAIWGSIVILCANGAYLLATPDGPHRSWLGLQAAASAISLTVVALPGSRLAPKHRLVVWVTTQNLLALTATWIDGGLHSPLLMALFVACALGALTMDRRLVLGMLGGSIAAMLGIGAATGSLDVGTVAVWPTGLATVTMISNWAGRGLVAMTRELDGINDELTYLAQTDSLTGCHNHRSLYERLEIELDRNRRHQRPVSALLLDIDHFKHINDTYGHPVGDEVLAAVGATLRAGVRQYDVVGRTGGEEFTILLPDTDLELALTVAERLRGALADTPTPEPVTVSIGVAASNVHADGAKELIHAADTALYVAKRAGRDRVVVAPTEPADAQPDASASSAARTPIPSSARWSASSGLPSPSRT